MTKVSKINFTEIPKYSLLATGVGAATGFGIGMYRCNLDKRNLEGNHKAELYGAGLVKDINKVKKEIDAKYAKKYDKLLKFKPYKIAGYTAAGAFICFASNYILHLYKNRKN